MKEIKTETCDQCNQTKRIISFFCDNCSKKTNDDLTVVFTEEYCYGPSESENKEFCSWTCLFDYLKKNIFDDDISIDLPYIEGYKELQEIRGILK